MNFSGGNKGALRIPPLSFQYPRRPGCTAKLLCFLIAGRFESHRLHQNLLNFAWLQRRCFRLPSRQFRCLLHLPGGHAPRSSLPPAPAPVAQAGGLGWRAEKKGGVFPLRKRGPKPHSESPHDLQAHCFKPLRIIFPCDPSHILSPCGNLILV